MRITRVNYGKCSHRKWKMFSPKVENVLTEIACFWKMFSPKVENVLTEKQVKLNNGKALRGVL